MARKKFVAGKWRRRYNYKCIGPCKSKRTTVDYERFKKKICHKCEGKPVNENQTKMF